jgi:predicted RNase H-like HicB family nuclease
MQYRAIIKNQGDWWIGWLVDLPGVNAQERSREELMQSLMIGAQEMLQTEVGFDPGAQMVVLDIPDPAWKSKKDHYHVL